MRRRRPPTPRVPCYVCSKPVEQARELVTVRMAMRICRVSRSTIKRWMRRGEIEFVRLASGIPRIYADSLLNDRRHRPGQFRRRKRRRPTRR